MRTTFIEACGKLTIVAIAGRMCQFELRRCLDELRRFDWLHHLLEHLLLLVQELDPMRFDLDDRSGRLVFAMPRAALEFAFDKHRASLAQLRHAAIGQFAPRNDAYIADVLRPLVRTIAKPVVRRETKVDDRYPVGGLTDHRVLRKVAGDHYVIDLRQLKTCHSYPFLISAIPNSEDFRLVLLA